MGHLFRPGAWLESTKGPRPPDEPRCSRRFFVESSDQNHVYLQGEGSEYSFGVLREHAEEAYRTFTFPRVKEPADAPWMFSGTLLRWAPDPQFPNVLPNHEVILEVIGVRRNWFATRNQHDKHLFFWELGEVLRNPLIRPLLPPLRFHREALLLCPVTSCFQFRPWMNESQ